MSHSTRSSGTNLFNHNANAADPELTAHYNKTKKDLLSRLQVEFKKQGCTQDEINKYISENWGNIKENLRQQYSVVAQGIVNKRKTDEKNSPDKAESFSEEKQNKKS